jgi:hypothetical protein
MKAKSIVIAIGMMLATSAWADAPNADATSPAAPAATSTPMATDIPAADAASTKLEKMDENLGRMHALVGQMKDAKDPAARQKLMMEYMTAQRENMMLTRDTMGMGGPSMGMMGGRKACDMDGMGKRDCDMDGMGMMGKRGCGMGPRMGMMRGGMDGMRDEALAARIQSMEKRLDVLQDMMKMMISR